jgi:hypothetical protein
MRRFKLSPNDRYINQHGKGSSFHTNDFLLGYDAGFEKCSGRRLDDDKVDESVVP